MAAHECGSDGVEVDVSCGDEGINRSNRFQFENIKS